jgi:hypothetical protein
MSDNKTTSLNLSLKSILVPSKEVQVEYPGMPGFMIDLTYLSRETLVDLRKKATTTKFSRAREVSESFDDELFLKMFVQKTVKGWKGFKLQYLAQLAPVELGENDLSAELEYTEENALFLMKNSNDFDSYVNSVITDLGNFQKNKSK